MYYFHPDITLDEVKHVARQLGCEIREDGKGNSVIAPYRATLTPAAPVQTNSNVVQMPRRHYRVKGGIPPIDPSAA